LTSFATLYLLFFNLLFFVERQNNFTGVEEEMGVETELTTNGEEEGVENGGENGEVREGETKETKVATSTAVSQTVTAWEDYLLDEEEEGKYFKIERERASHIIFFTTHFYITVFIISNFFFRFNVQKYNFRRRRGRGGTQQQQQ
jgi:hypothetical protein